MMTQVKKRQEAAMVGHHVSEEEKGGVDINWDSGVDRCVLPLHQLTLQYTWMFEHY
jgi:hypothetical protein